MHKVMLRLLGALTKNISLRTPSVVAVSAVLRTNVIAASRIRPYDTVQSGMKESRCDPWSFISASFQRQVQLQVDAKYSVPPLNLLGIGLQARNG